MGEQAGSRAADCYFCCGRRVVGLGFPSGENCALRRDRGLFFNRRWADLLAAAGWRWLRTLSSERLRSLRRTSALRADAGRLFDTSAWLAMLAAAVSVCVAREAEGVRALCQRLLRFAQMPGFRPGGRLTFLRAQKGEPKMRPCCLRPFEFRFGEIQEGNLRVLGRGLHRVTLCAPRRSVQTDTVSQSTKQLHSAVQLPAHALRSSAQSKGVGAG